MKSNTIAPDDSNYLQILGSIAKKPERLHYLGTIPAARVPTVAIVGTRKPTAYGKEITYRFAYDLAKRGIVVVSGLALGVDTIAHTAALEAGGTTIAVLGNGLPRIYPAANTQLGTRIIEGGGAILSEYEDGSQSYPGNFLERNRIVAGLADAVIITEAASRSGTLNTASHALEQGRDIFVVPGNITSPLSAGCNALIKQGANILTDYTDVLEVIAPTASNTVTALPLGSNQLETDIIAKLNQGMRDGELLLAELKADPIAFSTALTMLELSGTIRALGANQWTLR